MLKDGRNNPARTCLKIDVSDVRFDQLKVCLCTYKLKASGQETGLESNLGSLTSIFKQVLAGLLNPSFNKSYMRLFSKKQKKIIYICYFL